jgi:hypothetical protein
MLRLSHHLTKLALGAALLSVLGTCGSADEARPDDYVTRAMQLLRALYPGLHGVHAIIFDETDFLNRSPQHPDAINPLAISLCKSHVEPWDPPKASDPVLGARFTFDSRTNLLRLLWISGPVVNGRLNNLILDLNHHPDWSDTQVVKALKDAGAKYGPDDREAFLRSLPLKTLEPFTGHLDVVSADFGVRLPASLDEEESGFDLTWAVEAKWRSRDGHLEADYFLLFEPFDGALMNLSPRTPPTRKH